MATDYAQRLKQSEPQGLGMEHLGALIVLSLIVVPLWRICKRTGFSGKLSLLALIPWLGLLIVGALLSFAKWPDKIDRAKG